MIIITFYLYIDPSTGSMLFAVLLGLISTILFAFNSIMIKIKQGMGLRNVKIVDSEKENIVIYSDHKRYDNVFEPILDELERREIKAKFYTMSEDDELLKKSYKYIKCEYLENSGKGFAMLNNINAKICLSTTPGLNVYQWKKSKKCDNYIHIYHSLELNAAGYRMFGIDFYDTVFTFSDEIVKYIREIEYKRNLPNKKCEVVGITYLDKMLKRKRESKNSDEKIILVAPSWGKDSILEKYGEKFIDALIKTNYKIIIRPHPQMLTQNPKLLNELKTKYSNIEWNFDNDNFNVLEKSSVLISDFSAVVFDFVFVFEKPIIYTTYNKNVAPYDEFWLDDKNVYKNTLEQIGVELDIEKLDEIKNVIDNCVNDEKIKNNIKLLKEKYWKKQGESARVVVDKLLDIIETP